VFFCSGCIVGPFLEYSDFVNFMELTGDYKDLPATSLIPSVERLLHALACLALHITICGIYGWSVYFCGKEEFLTYGTWFDRIIFYNIAMTGQKYMYYCMWAFTDASVMASGITYDPKDGSYYKMTNIKIVDLETAWSCRDMMGHWNH
jgi:hypothetical protein